MEFAFSVNLRVPRVMADSMHAQVATEPTVKCTDSVFNAFRNALTVPSLKKTKICARVACRDANYVTSTTLMCATSVQRDTLGSNRNVMTPVQVEQS